MSKFRPYSNYQVRLRQHDGEHNIQAESEDSTHLIELRLTREQEYELLTKGATTIQGRVNGDLAQND